MPTRSFSALVLPEDVSSVPLQLRKATRENQSQFHHPMDGWRRVEAQRAFQNDPQSSSSTFPSSTQNGVSGKSQSAVTSKHISAATTAHRSEDGEALFVRNSFSLKFIDDIVEQEFLVYYLSSRSLPMGFAVVVTIFFLVGAVMYEGNTTVTKVLYAIIDVTWFGCGMGFYILRRREAIHRSTELIAAQDKMMSNRTRDTFDSVAEGLPSTPETAATLDDKGLHNQSVNGMLQSRNWGTTRAPQRLELLEKDAAGRIGPRQDAVIHEILNYIVIVVAFLYAVVNFLGKGSCFNPVWTYEDELRGCRRAIQAEGSAVLIIVAAAFTNPVRAVGFTLSYVTLTSIYFASRHFPSAIDVIGAYFWGSVVVIGVEVVVCIGYVISTEVEARKRFRVYVQCHQHTLEVAEIRRRTEAMASVQLPQELTIALRSGHLTPLFCWSDVSVCCVLAIDGFQHWAIGRGPSDVISVLERVFVTFDTISNMFDRHLLTSKYQSFGDAYVMLNANISSIAASLRGVVPQAQHVVRNLPPKYGSKPASNTRLTNTSMSSFQTDLMETANEGTVAALDAVITETVAFALMCLQRVDTILDRQLGRLGPSEVTVNLVAAGAIVIGEGGGGFHQGSRNLVPLGPVVSEALKCLSDNASAGGTSRGATLIISSAVASHGNIRVAPGTAQSFSEGAVEELIKCRRSAVENDAMPINPLLAPKRRSLAPPTQQGSSVYSVCIAVTPSETVTPLRTSRANPSQSLPSAIVTSDSTGRKSTVTIDDALVLSRPVTNEFQSASQPLRSPTHTMSATSGNAKIKSMSLASSSLSTSTDDAPKVGDNRVQLVRFHLIRHRFAEPAMEEAFHASLVIPRHRVALSFIATGMSIGSIVFLCGIDSISSFGPRHPLPYTIVALILCVLVCVMPGVLTPAGWTFVSAAVTGVVSLLVQLCFVVAVFLAPSGTVLGDSQMIWLYVTIFWLYHRPRWGPIPLMWLIDIFTSLAFFFRTWFLFDIHRPSSTVNLAYTLEICAPFITLTYRLLNDLTARKQFALDKQVALLRDDLEADFKQLENGLRLTVPEGVAGRLVQKARRENAAAIKRRKFHFLFSTSFGTGTDETPFLILQVEVDHAAQPAQPMSVSHPTSGSLNKNRAAALLLCVEKLGRLSSGSIWSEMIQLVKVCGNTLVFCSPAPSAKKIETRDEKRALSMFTFFRLVTQHFQAAMANDGIRVNIRGVAGTGYVTGVVIGRQCVSFEYYGSDVSSASILLQHIDWGSMIALRRLSVMACRGSDTKSKLTSAETHSSRYLLSSSASIHSPLPFRVRGCRTLHGHFLHSTATFNSFSEFTEVQAAMCAAETPPSK